MRMCHVVSVVCQDVPYLSVVSHKSYGLLNKIILLLRNKAFSIDRLFACAPDLVRNSNNRQTDRQNTNNLYSTLNRNKINFTSKYNQLLCFSVKEIFTFRADMFYNQKRQPLF